MHSLGHKSPTRQKRHARAENLHTAIADVCKQTEQETQGGAEQSKDQSSEVIPRRIASGSVASWNSSIFDRLATFPRLQTAPNPISSRCSTATFYELVDQIRMSV